VRFPHATYTTFPHAPPESATDHGPGKVTAVDARPILIEFPADDPERARRFWSQFLGRSLDPRQTGQGEGWETSPDAPAVGIHHRGRGPGDSFSLPYFAVADLDAAIERVTELGGTVVHPGERWAVCRDSEGSPFGLALEPET
jgi:predicted enzyme related to lactoylglutathione lyase